MIRPSRPSASVLRSLPLIVLALAIGLFGGVSARSLIAPAAIPGTSFHPATLPPHLGSLGAVSKQTTADLLDPLTIPAQQARSYPGGVVTVEQQIATAADYHSEELSYPSDGLKVYAQAVIPTATRPAKGYPTIILVHGNMPTETYRSDNQYYTYIANRLASQGFLVVAPDLRGFGNSWGAASGAYYSPDYTADVLNLYTALSTYPNANMARVGLFGHSMGGHVVLNTMAVAGSVFRSASIAAGSVGTLNDMDQNWQAPSDLSNPVAAALRRHQIDLHGTPDSDDPFWSQVDPYSYLGAIKRPIQLQYARDDSIVPTRFSDELASALTDVGNAPDEHIFDTGGHSFGDDDTLDKMTNNLADFYRRTL